MSAQSWHPSFENFPALTMTEAERSVEGLRDPIVQQIGAVWGGEGKSYSPGAASHPRTRAMLDKAHLSVVFWSLDAECLPRFIFGNLGRPVQPFKANGYSETDLRFLSPEDWPDVGPLATEAEYDLFYENVCFGGQPVQTLVIHSPEIDMTIAYPVMLNFSPRRQLSASECYLDEYRVCSCCGGDTASDAALTDFLLVSCGGFLRVFPCCAGCRRELDRDIQNLSWHRPDDYLPGLFGYTDDRYPIPGHRSE